MSVVCRKHPAEELIFDPAFDSYIWVCSECAKKHNGEIRGTEMSEELVDQHYEMNPETETILFDGTYLRDGMKVLIESPALRAHVKRENDVNTPIARVTNRWCVVSHVRNETGFTSFIATYDDDVMRKRSYPIDIAWLVKKDSLPENNVEDREKFKKVFDIIKGHAEAIVDSVARTQNVDAFSIRLDFDPYSNAANVAREILSEMRG